ncbi:MAG TPA: DMT family transporter [Clostridia bacterium]|nr:DMT family transporter [Clostridia bacterium]
MSLSIKMAALLMALLSGMAMAIQGTINSAFAKIIGLLEATLVVHLTATIAVAALVLSLRWGNTNFAKIGEAPWYLYLGGLLGVAITYLVVASIPRVGVAVATTAIIVGQVGMACLADHLGLFGMDKYPFTWYRLAGLVLLAAGARLMLNKI